MSLKLIPSYPIIYIYRNVYNIHKNPFGSPQIFSHLPRIRLPQELSHGPGRLRRRSLGLWPFWPFLQGSFNLCLLLQMWWKNLIGILSDFVFGYGSNGQYLMRKQLSLLKWCVHFMKSASANPTILWKHLSDQFPFGWVHYTRCYLIRSLIILHQVASCPSKKITSPATEMALHTTWHGNMAYCGHFEYRTDYWYYQNVEIQ